MARSSRTWSDRSPQERQRAMVVLGVVGLVLVAIAVFVFTSGGGDDPAGAAEVESSPTVPGNVTKWYEGTAELRGEVINASTAVRAFIEAEDGIQLQPACISLAEQASKAVAYPPAPDPEIQRLWSDGATGFADAATTCATIWSLSTEPPTVILANVTAKLDDAEVAWADLAEKAGQPLPDLPTGTIAPNRPPAATATPTPTLTASTPAPAGSTPDGLPPVSIGPLFETPSQSPPAPAPTATPNPPAPTTAP